MNFFTLLITYLILLNFKLFAQTPTDAAIETVIRTLDCDIGDFALLAGTDIKQERKIHGHRVIQFSITKINDKIQDIKGIWVAFTWNELLKIYQEKIYTYLNSFLKWKIPKVVKNKDFLKE